MTNKYEQEKYGLKFTVGLLLSHSFDHGYGEKDYQGGYKHRKFVQTIDHKRRSIFC